MPQTDVRHVFSEIRSEAPVLQVIISVNKSSKSSSCTHRGAQPAVRPVFRASVYCSRHTCNSPGARARYSSRRLSHVPEGCHSIRASARTRTRTGRQQVPRLVTDHGGHRVCPSRHHTAPTPSRRRLEGSVQSRQRVISSRSAFLPSAPSDLVTRFVSLPSFPCPSR